VAQLFSLGGMSTNDTLLAIVGIVTIGAWFFRTSLIFRIALAVLFVWFALLRFAPRVAFFVTGIAAASFILYSAFRALQTGVIEIRVYSSVSIYERENNPVEFWFFTFLCICFGIGFGISTVYISTH
jgi:hypothetical protein